MRNTDEPGFFEISDRWSDLAGDFWLFAFVIVALGLLGKYVYGGIWQIRLAMLAVSVAFGVYSFWKLSL